MWLFLLPILVLITFGLLVDWRTKRHRKIHQEVAHPNARPEERLDYKMEDDRKSPQGYL